MTDEHEDREGLGVLWFWLFVGAAFIVGTLLASYLGIPRLSKPPNGSGEFGDMFGAPNALLSGLAFLGVIAAILLQRKELQNQGKELRKQGEQMEMQSKTFALQTFDNTFFQMLSLHSDIVQAMDFEKATGRDCFGVFFQRMTQDATTVESVPTRLKGQTQFLTSRYTEMYDKHESDLGHYFRTLYNMVKFVDQSDVKDKKFYTNLIRAQLSSNELQLLFYNCLTKRGEKFKLLVERYALLKHHPQRPEDVGSYNVSAYGES